MSIWKISIGDTFGGKEYESPEEAIKAAPAELVLMPGQKFRVGRVGVYPDPEIDGTEILEQLTSEAEDVVGEAADDWFLGVTREEEAEPQLGQRNSVQARA